MCVHCVFTVQKPETLGRAGVAMVMELTAAEVAVAADAMRVRYSRPPPPFVRYRRAAATPPRRRRHAGVARRGSVLHATPRNGWASDHACVLTHVDGWMDYCENAADLKTVEEGWDQGWDGNRWNRKG